PTVKPDSDGDDIEVPDTGLNTKHDSGGGGFGVSVLLAVVALSVYVGVNKYRKIKTHVKFER
ncbi:MAG: hypothetical protein Q4A70_02775, partial [Candidatus Saccharibacteria bacterium]|nr:hypothetical protein [Candidatus Saccharibacteria bacterium]